ncbi:MAG: hypothetical protein J0I09_04650 [Sphingobacteriia bacterium]|nr:hypothetical protein [Sphingobacteriia bacterium]
MRSNFSFWRFYIIYLFILILLCVSFYLFLQPSISLKTKFGTELPAPFAGVFFFILGGWLFSIINKWSTILIINNQQLILKQLFKNKEIKVDEISKIDLLARESIGSLSNSKNVNCTAIVLKNGEKIILPDSFYANVLEIKETLRANFKELVVEPESRTALRKKTDTVFPDYEEFSGNYITSLNGILFYGMLLVSVYFILTSLSSQRFVPIFFALLYVNLLMYFVLGV